MLLRSTCTKVDLSNISENVQEIKKFIGDTQLMAVVKGKAYGHGLVEVAKTVLQAGATWLGVAIPQEGEILRNEGITAPILVLSLVNVEGAIACAQNDLTFTLCDAGMLPALQAHCQKHDVMMNVHLKIDTGMGRIGVRTQAEVEHFLHVIEQMPALHLTGVYTHFADADDETSSFSTLQMERFTQFLPLFPKGILVHACASAATLRFSNYHFDMVRMGIAMYGYSNVSTTLTLRPALSWHTEVAHVKQVAKGTPIGYNCTYTMPRDGKVATLTVGYADGYHRAFARMGQVLVHGKRCKIIGTICMDQMMVDVTNVPEVAPGDEVVLLGTQQGETIDASEMATWANTIHYEVLLMPTMRVPTYYI